MTDKTTFLVFSAFLMGFSCPRGSIGPLPRWRLVFESRPSSGLLSTCPIPRVDCAGLLLRADLRPGKTQNKSCLVRPGHLTENEAPKL
jgi:hypothetical protein